MGFTEEGKKHFVKEINNKIGSNPIVLLKFCKEKQFAIDVCNGKLYSNTPKSFRENEIESGERGQGDKHELISIIEAHRALINNEETEEIILTAPRGSLRIQFKEDDRIPMVSFVGIPLEEMILVEADEQHASFIFPFSDDEYKKMENNFGKYVVFINTQELEKHIISYCDYAGCKYILDKIEYCNQNRLDRMQAFNNCAKERFLYKDSDLAYQKEHRLVLSHEIPNDHSINVGMLTNTKVVESNQLKSMVITIKYAGHHTNQE